MAKIKKNLSLEESILNKGMARAEKLGYNFSSYITYLINKDAKNEEIEIKVKNETDDSKLPNEISDEVDNILNI